VLRDEHRRLATEARFARFGLTTIAGEDGSFKLRIVDSAVEVFAVTSR
jgi:hypothetical protein